MMSEGCLDFLEGEKKTGILFFNTGGNERSVLCPVPLQLSGYDTYNDTNDIAM
jgi:hypothetical protein